MGSGVGTPHLSHQTGEGQKRKTGIGVGNTENGDQIRSTASMSYAYLIPVFGVLFSGSITGHGEWEKEGSRSSD